jgi:hypothetical protein
MGHLLGVVQESEWTHAMVAQALVVEEDARDDKRPGEAPAPRFVDSGHEPSPEAAVESEKSSSGPAHALRIEAAVGRSAQVTLWTRCQAISVTTGLRRAPPGAAR